MAEASSSQASYAREYIRALLKGSTPNGTPLAAWRDHRDVIGVLEQAHNTGGTPAVRRAMVSIVRRHPELIPLIAGNGGDGTASVWVPPEGWPVLDPDALYGLAGELTVAITPYTEADPVAVLLNILTAFGNAVGSEPHFRVEFTKHHLRLFVVLVGPSAKGRKGQSWSTPRYVFSRIDGDWARDRVSSGLSSGEGLIYHVRDPRVEKQPVKEKGRVVDYEEVIVDHGVSDKRLLIVEEEFAQALKVMSREGNILSPVLRQAWDTGDLHPLTKTNPIRATEVHISIIGHITRAEDYAALSAEKPGMLGAMTARAEAQVMRLACLYAALDKTCLVSPAHLKAARALWRYCEASVRYVFGARTGDPVADRILLALSASSGLFDRHMEQARLEQALQLLNGRD